MKLKIILGRNKGKYEAQVEQMQLAEKNRMKAVETLKQMS